ncbi:MAG: hypothetical protein JW809_13895 [Pirellulales bacterium]|nr:hypothetical protein [Pirellulales bacterium]
MSKEITVTESVPFPGAASKWAPAIVAQAGSKATRRFYEFFTATIRNMNMRAAYYRAVSDFFAWCDDHGFELITIEPIVVAAYVEYLSIIYSKPTVKQHLAAIRMCFDWLVTRPIPTRNLRRLPHRRGTIAGKQTVAFGV